MHVQVWFFSSSFMLEKLLTMELDLFHEERSCSRVFVGHSCSQIFHSQEHTSNYMEDWSTVSWYV